MKEQDESKGHMIIYLTVNLNPNTTWCRLGPIFREVKVRSIDRGLDVDDPASNQYDSNPATATPLLRWLSTKQNLIDLAEKTFPASESKDTGKKM